MPDDRNLPEDPDETPGQYMSRILNQQLQQLDQLSMRPDFPPEPSDTGGEPDAPPDAAAAGESADSTGSPPPVPR